MTVYVDDVVAWLRGREWLVQSGFMPRYHAVLCDPPYGLAFMGQHWDTMTAEQYQAWCTEWATLLLSFVYPGAVLLAFGGTRTFHRLAAGLEDAGWIVADTIAWITGQGFPKSHNGRNWDAGEHWHGYGTALKPAWEGVVVARAPWRGTYAALAREFGTGAINVDGGRIQFANNEPYSIDERCRPNTRGTKRKPSVVDYVHEIAAVNVSHLGRWPANLILGCACESAEHDADCPVRLLGEQSGELTSGTGAIKRATAAGWQGSCYGKESRTPGTPNIEYGDSGGAARFFKTVNSSPACVLCNLPIGVESSRITPYPAEGEQWQIASSVDKSTSPASLHSGSAHAPALQSGPHRSEGNSLNSGGPANNAESSSKNTSPTGTPIAPNNAPMTQSVQSALSARFAESLCDSCATAIAQSVAVMRQGKSPESRLCRACMPEHSAQILSRNLVRFAESLDNTDTTTITASLSRLLGFVQLAIESIIAERSSASVQTRFSYHSKAAAWEREAGLSDRPQMTVTDGRKTPIDNPYQCGETKRRNVHPTVKPIQLTEYLARLLLPPELDEPRRLLIPFAGSGSEMIGAHLAGWDVVHGIEQSEEYVAIARARLAWWAQFPDYDSAKRAHKKEKKKSKKENEEEVKQLVLEGEWS